MKSNYEVVCYRIMFKQKEEEKWVKNDYINEEAAIEIYKCIKKGYRFCKMLKIEHYID